MTTTWSRFSLVVPHPWIHTVQNVNVELFLFQKFVFWTLLENFERKRSWTMLVPSTLQMRIAVLTTSKSNPVDGKSSIDIDRTANVDFAVHKIQNSVNARSHARYGIAGNAAGSNAGQPKYPINGFDWLMGRLWNMHFNTLCVVSLYTSSASS